MNEDELYPWRKPPENPNAQNCSTCANFPCPAYEGQGNRGQMLDMGGNSAGEFRLAAVPMACGGVDWKPKPVAPERKVREREGSALDQFK